MFTNRRFNLIQIVAVFCLLLLINLFALGQNEAVKEADEIYAKYQVAINTKQLKTIEIISETESLGVKRKETFIEDKLNKKWYRSFEGGIEGKRESGFDGKRNWSKTPSFRGYQDRKGGVTLSQDFFESRIEKRIKRPNEKIDGKEYLVLEEIFSTAARAKSYFDPLTFLLFKRKITIPLGSQTLESIDTYTDYREIDGIFVPFIEKRESRQYGSITKRITNIKFNPEVDPQIFEY